MEIAIKSVTVGTDGAAAASVSVTTSESPSATAVGDLVVVFHGNDFYALSNMGAVTATGSPTVNAIAAAVADGGTNLAHVKSYWYVANTAGAQTISAAETGAHDEEKVIVAYVLSGADTTTPIDDAAAAFSASSVTPQDAPAVSPTTADAFLICHLNSGGSFFGGPYTPPSGMTERYDGGVSGFLGHTGATLQLAASGSTGTKSFTPTGSTPFAAVSVAIKTAAAAAAAADPWRTYSPGTALKRKLGVRRQTSQVVPVSGPQAYTSPLAGTVGFTGADATRTSKGLTAATVGFTGSLTKRLARALAATVSFTGALGTAAVHNFTQALTATLSFTGAQSRRVGKGIAATVSFTGSQAKATAVSKSAAVSFTGAQVRRVGTTLTAAVSFTGTQARRVGHGMTAAVSFTGSHATAAVHFFTQTFTGTVGFTGSVATQAVHVFTKALTATVGFTGSVARRTARSVAATVGLTAASLSRRIGSGQSATVGFTGSVRRAIGRRLSAAVGFVGNLLGQGSGAPTADPARILSVTLRIAYVHAELRTHEVTAELRIPTTRGTLR